MLPSEKLAELGLELPAVATPVAAYVPAATAAALGGGDIRVYQLKLLPISHVSSFNPATRARSLG